MSTSSSPATITYRIDPSHTLIELSAKHMMFTTVKGRFTGVTGTIVEAPHDPAGGSSVDVEIDAGSLTTGDEKRDGHLRSADFLDVEHYPTISFKSTRFDGSGDKYKVIGNLTIHGTAREVALDTTVNGTAKNPFGKQIVGYTAETQINRKDFGLNWNVALEAGGVLVSDNVKVLLEVQAVLED